MKDSRPLSNTPGSSAPAAPGSDLDFAAIRVRVTLCVKSTFTAIALRKPLDGSPAVLVQGEARDGASAHQLLLAHPNAVAVVDLDLLLDDSAEKLRTLLAARRDPTVLVNARGATVPDNLTRKPNVHVLSGRHAGSLDIGHVQEALLRTIQLARAAKVHMSAPGAGPSAYPAASDPPAVSPARTGAHAGAPHVMASPSTPASGLVQTQRGTSPPAASGGGLEAPKRGAAQLIVIGVSTGGPTVLLKILKGLQRPTIPTVIVQHMPRGETAGFAQRLGEECGHPVLEIGPGPLPEPPTIGLLQGGEDFSIALSVQGRLRLRPAQVPDNPFHPSVDHVLLTAAENGIATHTVILTGMGQDGAAGALALSRQGYPVIAQRPETCAVAGMPGAAIQNGAAKFIQSPEQITDSLNRWYSAVKPRAEAAP